MTHGTQWALMKYSLTWLRDRRREGGLVTTREGEAEALTPRQQGACREPGRTGWGPPL